MLIFGILAPLAADAKPPARIARIGVLGDTPGTQWNTFRQALRDLGWVQGQNVEMEFRWSDGTTARFPELAGELVRLRVDVIVTEGGPATRAVVTVLWNPTSPAHPTALKEIEAAAAALRIKVQPVGARSADELESAFSTIIAQRSQGLLILGTPIFDAQQKRIAEFASRSRLPAVFNKPPFAEAGGLMVYGARYADFFRRAATCVDKILKGARPADLPVEQPTKFELIINLKTAKALGLTIPQSVLIRADQVIQ